MSYYKLKTKTTTVNGRVPAGTIFTVITQGKRVGLNQNYIKKAMETQLGVQFGPFEHAPNLSQLEILEEEL